MMLFFRVMKKTCLKKQNTCFLDEKNQDITFRF